MQFSANQTVHKKSHQSTIPEPLQYPYSEPQTFNVAQLSNRRLSRDGGFLLPPLMLRSEIRPTDVVNASFRLVKAKARTVTRNKKFSDQLFNASVDRLIRCFKDEVDITKRLRKTIKKKHTQQTSLMLIRQLETLRGNYELERSNIMAQLNLHLPSCSGAADGAVNNHNPSPSDIALPIVSPDCSLTISKSTTRQKGGDTALHVVPSNKVEHKLKNLSESQLTKDQAADTGSTIDDVFYDIPIEAESNLALNPK